MAEKSVRRIVYFIGAGSSLGAGATAKIEGGGRIPIPIQETFWQTFLRFSKRAKNKKLIESFLFRYFLGYAKLPNRSKKSARRKLLQPIDVEEVFTFLSERNNAPQISPSVKAYTQKVWDALVEEIGEVFSRFDANDKTKKVFKGFRANHVRSRDSVVSFNYDVVFERSLPSNYAWYYGGLEKSHKKSSLRILKPHGSINWRDDQGVIKRKAKAPFPKPPVVVAPTHLKFVGMGSSGKESRPIGYLGQEITNVWTIMEREMREAKGWVFIGYSFPPSDLYFSSILRSALTARDNNPFIVIVNPDSMAISARLRNRFSIPQDRVRTYSDWQSFNQVPRGEIIRMFSS